MPHGAGRRRGRMREPEEEQPPAFLARDADRDLCRCAEQSLRPPRTTTTRLRDCHRLRAWNRPTARANVKARSRTTRPLKNLCSPGSCKRCSGHGGSHPRSAPGADRTSDLKQAAERPTLGHSLRRQGRCEKTLDPDRRARRAVSAAQLLWRETRPGALQRSFPTRLHRPPTLSANFEKIQRSSPLRSESSSKDSILNNLG